MKRSGWIVMGLACMIVISACITSFAGDPTSIARSFVQLLADAKFTEAERCFDGPMSTALPAPKLQETWNGLLSQAGAFKQMIGTRQAQQGQYTVVYIISRFEKATIDIKVVLDVDLKIGGLWFQPHQETYEYQPPTYVKPDRFTEKEVTVGHGEFALPGTLSLPKGKGPFPAVILVHGSGPNDRDESVGASKPFRDLAWGLASNGIAVLRYDKRTKVYPGKLVGRPFTVKEETVDDALSAVSLLRSSQHVDPKRIFVLGHSLGGMLIPRIGVRDPKIRGFIVMAGPARPLEDAIVGQLTYIYSLKGEISPEEKKQLDAIKAEMAKVKDPKLSPESPPIMGVPASYWLDLRGYNPPLAAKQLKRPILVLQGGRDYQVTVKEFDAWKNALSSRKNVTFRLYPNLNHLFVVGKGMSTPSEYEKPGQVAGIVIGDIAKWIRKS